MKIRARVVVVMLLMLVAACNKTPSPPLVFGANIWSGYEPVFLARELGYFSTENLRIAEYRNASEVKQAFLRHELHLAAVTLEDALLLSRDIPDLKIVFLLDGFNRADDIPAQRGMTDSVPGNIFNVLVTRDDDMGRYHNEMVGLVQGWQAALDFIHTQPDKATQIMSRHEQVDPVQLGKMVQGIQLLGVQRNRELLLGEPPAVAASVESVQRYLLGRGLINMGADTATILDTSLLAGVAK